MNTDTYRDDVAEHRTFTPRKWLSDNDDRAWAEKFYLIYIPVFFIVAGIFNRYGTSLRGLIERHLTLVVVASIAFIVAGFFLISYAFEGGGHVGCSF